MDSETILELGRGSIMLTLTLALPVLLAAMVIGFLAGLFQALTQIQEQTLAFVPKVIVVLLVLGLGMPWMLSALTEFTREVISGIPEMILP
ncbi:MAG: flagellar biosynthesis protein FliQ [Planctomycetaceae bacterium]|nr:flagellar biosynthesis protein FliQ [Planctomycetaceae bacterium]MBQ2820284.1 flagellar biosynthesis protein FliQ [Thermoguttaceae bacterium]MDO4425542.1 flagellar biosynthesis protein FliQ [Planctomycetia bacterium]